MAGQPFAGNSGIKIWGIYEIQIFDTQEMLNISDVSVDALDGMVSSPSYSPDEKANVFLTGVPYGSDDYSAMEDYSVTPLNTNRYLKALENNAIRFANGGYLTIVFEPNGTGGYSVAVYSAPTVDPLKLVYSNSNVTHGTGNSGSTILLSSISNSARKIRIQTHWDSGVEFTELKIGPLPD